MTQRDKERTFALPAECLDRFSSIEKRLERIEETQVEFRKYWPYIEKMFETLHGLYARMGEVKQMAHDMTGTMSEFNLRLEALESTTAETKELVRNGNSE